MKNYGFNGKILRIDLTSKTTTVEKMEENWYRIYGGGGLMGTYFMLKDTPAKIDAFDPQNALIFVSSIIAGQDGPGLAKFSVVTKSPLSQGIAEARCEGPWGEYLKGSGYDAIVITGKAKDPVYLLVEKEQVTIECAKDLWGKNTNQTTGQLEQKYGAENIQCAVIGQAGENLVRYASIVTAYSIQAARMGTGAVMGSKNLKGVVLKGKKIPEVFDRQGLNKIKEYFTNNMQKNELSMWQKEAPGFSASADLSDYDTAYMGVNNFKSNLQVETSNYTRSKYMEYYKGHHICPGCDNDCIKYIDPGMGVPKAAGIHQEATGAMGPNIGNTNLKTMLEANVLCNLYGLDPASLGFTISFAMESFENGFISKDDIDGIELNFGNEKHILQLIKNIALREGFGDVLAEGVKRASDQLGNNSKDYALHVKGVEMVSFEPRTQTNLALGYATAPVGPRYEICEHDWDYDIVSGWEHTMDYSRTLGILERIPMEYVGPKKVRNYKVLSNLWSACDTLNLCIFASAPTRLLSLEMITKLIQSITGWHTSSYEFIRWGERRNHLMRIYNLREGLTKEDDTLPKRFFKEPIKEGRLKGVVIDEKKFKESIFTYYQMMGWDEGGVPLLGTLYDHHLEWTIGL